ncbi:protein YgfX [Paraglaciecola sp.]|uniref:protein YgfX n=1 Tax=Paraglaciecola sp. TaxID=1920173 RepID=UPI003EF81D0A
MSKYRVALQKSRIGLLLRIGIFLLLVTSVWSWQAEIMPFQWFVQFLMSIGLIYIGINKIRAYKACKLLVFSFTQKGEWQELEQDNQSSWLISQQSRVMGIMLLIRVTSVLNTKQSKWVTIYKDQVCERDYRRLCRAIIFQHQNVEC